MTSPSRLLVPVVTLVTAGLLAACGGGEDATPAAETSTTGTSTTDDSSETETESSSPAPPDGPAQQELTKKQLTAALPTKKDAPKGFVEDDRITAGKASTRKTDPDRCRAVYLDTDEIRTWKKKHLSATDAVRYTQPGDAAGRASVSIFIATYDEPVPKQYFDQAGSTLGDCEEFSEQGSSTSGWQDKRASNISAPVVGDQSYAHRVGLAELDLTIDQLWVRSGHNLINIRVLTGNSNHSDETMSDLADAVLDDLEG